VKRLGYTLVNIGGFFREEDIEYSPCNLNHPKSPCQFAANGGR
jgi:hypothetical protein